MRTRAIFPLLAIALAACVTDPATSRRPVAAGVTDGLTYVCYDQAKDLVYGNPREVAARGCLQDDRRVSVEEAARLKKERWLGQPASYVLSSERACRDALTERVYALPLTLMSGVALKCAAGDEELTHARARELLTAERDKAARSPETERLARASMEAVGRLSSALQERRFADLDRTIAEMESVGEIVTAVNWLSGRIEDGGGAATVRAYVALVAKTAGRAKDPATVADLMARMTAYLYLVTTIDGAKCASTKAAGASLGRVIVEAAPHFSHLASVSRERRDRAVMFAIAKERSLAQRRGNDAWVCGYDAGSNAAEAEIFVTEAVARSRAATFRAIFPASLAHLVELMVHDSSRL